MVLAAPGLGLTVCVVHGSWLPAQRSGPPVPPAAAPATGTCPSLRGPGGSSPALLPKRTHLPRARPPWAPAADRAAWEPRWTGVRGWPTARPPPPPSLSPWLLPKWIRTFAGRSQEPSGATGGQGWSAVWCLLLCPDSIWAPAAGRLAA